MRRNSRTLFGVLAVAGLLTAAASASDKGLDLPKYTKTTFDNGATLVVVPQHEVPLASIQILIRGGGVMDPQGQDGLTSLAVDALRKGAGSRTAAEIALALDSHGASLGTGTDDTATTISLDLLARDLDFGVALLADLILRPTFPEAEVNKLRDRAIDGIKSAKEQPQSVIPLYFGHALFGDHPLGRPTIGSETTLAGLNADLVKAQWHNAVCAPRVVIAVGGDVDPAAVEKVVRAAFESIPTCRGDSCPPLPKLAIKAPLTGRRVVLIDMPDAVQTYFWLGNVGVAQGYPREAAFDIVRTAFGGRFTSMLNSELRIKTGLTYGARLSLEQLEVPGRMAISSFTATEKTKEALDIALRTLGELKDNKLAEPVVASAKAYLRGQLPPTLETAHAVTGAVLELIRFGLPDTQLTEYFARLDAVTPADAAAVIDEVFPKPDDLLMVLIGNAAAIKDIAASYGPVETKTLADPGF